MSGSKRTVSTMTRVDLNRVANDDKDPRRESARRRLGVLKQSEQGKCPVVSQPVEDWLFSKRRSK